MNASGAQAGARRTAQALNGSNADSAHEFGYTPDARSLSVCERYLWWTFAMASQMTGWLGDMDDRIGNLDLPFTVVAAADRRDPDDDNWAARDRTQREPCARRRPP